MLVALFFFFLFFVFVFSRKIGLLPQKSIYNFLSALVVMHQSTAWPINPEQNKSMEYLVITHVLKPYWYSQLLSSVWQTGDGQSFLFKSGSLAAFLSFIFWENPQLQLEEMVMCSNFLLQLIPRTESSEWHLAQSQKFYSTLVLPFLSLFFFFPF